MSFTFTPIFSDTFVRANEEPLNPANWTNVLSQPGSSLSVLSDACAADASINDGYEVCVGATFPADQYAEAIIGAYSNASPNEGSSVPVVVRGSSSSSTSGYSFTVFGNGDGTSKLQLFGGNIGGGVGLTQVLAHVNTGDKIRIEAIGITITGLYNGVVIFTANDSTYATGLPGLEVQYDLVHTDTTVTLFTAGSIKTV